VVLCGQPAAGHWPNSTAANTILELGWFTSGKPGR
jgi:hypothetical protein